MNPNRRLLFVLMGFLLFSLNLRAEVISFGGKETGIDGSQYLTSYSSFEKGGTKFKISQFNPSTGQMKVNNTLNNAFSFCNSTELKGIKKITITHTKESTSTSIGTIYLRMTDVEDANTITTSNNIKGVTTTGSDNSVTTFEVPEEKQSKGFFKIQITTKGKGSCYATKFEIEYGDGGNTPEPEICLPPVITGDTTFSNSTQVTMAPDPSQPTAKIYYVLDANEFFTPTQYATEYTEPITITETTYVSAIAMLPDGTKSTATQVLFTKTETPQPPAPGWILVNGASELETGARYIIGYNGRAISNAAVVSNKLQGTAASVTNGVLTPTDEMMVFTLEEGSKENSYLLKSNNYNNTTTDYYLTISGSSSTNATMSTTKKELYVTYAANSADVNIKLNTTDSRILMGSNVADAVFGYYATSNTGYHKVQLYKEVDEREACTTPVITLNPASVIEGESINVKIDAAAGEAVRYTTDGSAPSATAGTLYEGEFTITAPGKDITVKAIATADGKKNSKVASATAVVTLKPRMPKVSWSIDGQNFTAQNNGDYEVAAGTILTIAAVNGDKVKIVDMETEEEQVLTSPASYSVTADVMLAFCSVSGEMVSEPLETMFTIKKVMPATPVVTWTLDGTAYTADDEGEYNVYAGTQINVNSANATSILVESVNETCAVEKENPLIITLTEDDMFTFKGKNENGTSSEITVQFNIVERPAEQIYRLVTSAQQLQAGNKYVIAYNDADFPVAMSNNGALNNAKNEYQAAITDGFIIDANNVLHDRTMGTTTSEGIMVFTLGQNNGKWTLTADNYICPQGHGNGLTLDQTYLRMTSTPSDLNISISADGYATINGGDATAGYVIKFGTTATRFGLYKTTNDFPLVQLYRYEGVMKPETPVVTYTVTADDEPIATEEGETYTAVNAATVTITSTNATAIDVNGTIYPAVNGSCTLTIDVDNTLLVKGINEAGESNDYIVEFLIDYEASTIPQMHTLSLKQKDRTNSKLNAPVKFTGWTFVMGHFYISDLYEHLWIEDVDGNTAVIFDDENGDLAETTILLERSTQIRNFIVRAANYTGTSNGMQLIAWPEHTAEHVQQCDYPKIEKHESVGAHNAYKCIRVEGDMTFTANGGSIKLANGQIVTVSNVLTKKDTDKSPRTSNGTFDWNIGQEWPQTGTQMNGIHLAGFVMPVSDGNYELYPAQVTDTEDNITGTDVIISNQDVYIIDGQIIAPDGSHIFSLAGNNINKDSKLANGIYVVVLPNGKAIKLLVK